MSNLPEKAESGTRTIIINTESQSGLVRPRYFNDLNGEEKRHFINQMEKQIKSGYGSFDPEDRYMFWVSMTIFFIGNMLFFVFMLNRIKPFLNLRYEVYEILSVVALLIYVRGFISVYLYKLDRRIFFMSFEKIMSLKSRYF